MQYKYILDINKSYNDQSQLAHHYFMYCLSDAKIFERE